MRGRASRSPLAVLGPAVVLAVATLSCPVGAPAQEGPRTRVVLLGTGTPNADPERSGPAVAVVVDDRSYLFDAGPGVVRRAAQAAGELGSAALRPPNLERVFITHLHSDHTVGLPDILLGGWVLNRAEPLAVYGPPGIEGMMDGILAAWSTDIDVRRDGLEPREGNADAYRADVHTLQPGPAYEDELVRIEAIEVSHGSFELALGYRVVGPDRTIVISGDAAPSESIVEACDGCDVLVHEVYTAEGLLRRPPEWQRYHSTFHTSTVQMADIARRSRAGLVVLYHLLMWGTDADGLVREIRAAGYDGPLVAGRDLAVY